MLVTVKGIYTDGVIHLSEPGPAAPAEVLVTFLEGTPAALSAAARPPQGPLGEKRARLLASWQQARSLLAGMKGPSLSEEVLAERYEDE